MRKSTIFISAVLTTFALVMLYSLISAYRGNQNAAEVAAVQPAATLTPQATEAPTQAVLSPEEAAQIAVQVVGHDNLLSAESSNVNGVDAYKITFTNKDVVYVGLDGQVLSVQIAPVFVNVAPPVKKERKNNDNGNSGGGTTANAGGEHENGDD